MKFDKKKNWQFLVVKIDHDAMCRYFKATELSNFTVFTTFEIETFGTFEL